MDAPATCWDIVDATALWDVDPLFCGACYSRGWPPHDTYLLKLLNGKGLDYAQMHVIASYAYPVYCQETQWWDVSDRACFSKQTVGFPGGYTPG